MSLFHKCTKCKKEFGLYDKKRNGLYFLTCQRCRSKQVPKINTTIECGQCKSCRSVFKPNQKIDGSFYKTCIQCLAKRNGYINCEKCNVEFTYKNDTLCDKCKLHIQKYKNQLCNRSERIRKEMLETLSEEDKIRFLESQINYLYYCNNISGNIIENLRCCSSILYYKIRDKVTDSINWFNLKLVFIKPLYCFDNKNDFSSHDNIDISS